MNRELLKALKIDEKTGLREMLDKLEKKQVEYLERLQGTSDDARREELEKYVGEIEQEIECVKKEIREAEFSLVFDDGDAKKNSENEKENLSGDNTSEKIEAMKKHNAEKAMAKKENAAAGSSGSGIPDSFNSASAASSGISGGSASGGTGRYTNDMLGAVTAYNAGDYAAALKIYSQEAEAGDPVAQFMIGHMYLQGMGCDKNYDRFVFWMKKSAEQDYIDAQSYLGSNYLMFGDGKSAPSSSAAKKYYKEGLAWLEKSADNGNESSMKNYIITVEQRFSGTADERIETIRTLLNQNHVKKAMDYCEKLSAASSDSFEKQDWLNKRTALKKGKPYRGSTKSGTNAGTKSRRGGCSRFILLFILLFFGLPLVIWLIVSPLIKLGEGMEHDADNAESRIVSMLEENEGNASNYDFGTANLDLFDMPDERVLDQKLITNDPNQLTKSYNYSVDGETWNKAFLYRAGNGSRLAYTDYNIDGKFDSLTFRMTPLLDNGVFNTSAQVQVADLDSGKILYDYTLEKEAGAVEAEVRISGISNIRLSVGTLSGGGLELSYVLIKDAILHTASDTVNGNEQNDEN